MFEPWQLGLIDEAGYNGIRPEHIETAGLCTSCNPEILYSHRKSGNQRGNLAAFLQIK